jgi:hypothetical protein
MINVWDRVAPNKHSCLRMFPIQRIKANTKGGVFIMSNCLNCEYCNITTEDATGYTEARCKGGKSPRKGKMLTWSHTILNSPDEFDVKITGKDNALQAMAKKKVPAWCPLKSEVYQCLKI